MGLYDDLGIAAGASLSDVKSAHRRRAKETHPDKEGGSREAFDKVQPSLPGAERSQTPGLLRPHGRDR